MNGIISKDKKWLIYNILIASILILCVGLFLMYCLSSLSKYIPLNLIYIFCTLTGTIVGVSYLYFKYPFNFSHFGFDKKNIGKVMLWGGIGSIILVLINFPYAIVSGTKNIPQEHFIETQQGIHFIFLYLIIAVVMIPFAEELFFRAYLFRLVKIEFSTLSGYFVSTGFFALAHEFSISSAVHSLIFCFIYDKAGLIGTSIIAHAVSNFVWYSAVYGVVNR